MSVKGKHRSGEKTTIGNGAKVTAVVTALVLLAAGSFAVTRLVASGSDGSSNPITASLEGAVVKPASPSKSPASSEDEDDNSYGNSSNSNTDDSSDNDDVNTGNKTKTSKDKDKDSDKSKTKDKDKSSDEKNSLEMKDKNKSDKKYSEEEDSKKSNSDKTPSKTQQANNQTNNAQNNTSTPTPAPTPQQKPQNHNNGGHTANKPSNGNHNASKPSGGNTNASGAQFHLDWMSPSGEQPDLSGYTEVSLDVDISNETVTVYADGSPVYVMHASTSDHGATPIGTYTIRARGDGYANSDGTGYKWWVGPDMHTCLVHSVPVGSDGNWLESEASKLGGKSNIYGVSLSVPDAEWVYNSVPAGSTIVIHK